MLLTKIQLNDIMFLAILLTIQYRKGDAYGITAQQKQQITTTTHLKGENNMFIIPIGVGVPRKTLAMW